MCNRFEYPFYSKIIGVFCQTQIKLINFACCYLRVLSHSIDILESSLLFLYLLFYAVKLMFSTIIQTYLWWFKVHIPNKIRAPNFVQILNNCTHKGIKLKGNRNLRFILYNGYLINYTKNALFTTKTLDLFTYCS